jgi:integrase
MGVYRRTDAATYWMSLVIDGKRLRQDTGVQDRTVAGEIFAAWQVQLARARWLGLPAPTTQHTVQELLAEYTAKVTPRKSPASQRRDHVVLERFRKRWGSLDLDQLNNKTVEDYLTERLHDVTLATVSKELGVLKSAYARAMRWDWVSTTPFRGIALNQEGEERVRWLTDDEEAQLLATAAPWLREFILVGLDTGLRRSNLVGLQWSWLHDQGTVLVGTTPVGESQEGDGDDPADRPSSHDHSAAEATRAARVYALGWTGVLSGSGRHGRHSHGETGAVARSEFAYPPAYLHQPPGPGGTTAPRGRRAGWAPRYQDDAPLCAPRTQSSPGWDSGVGAAEFWLPGGTRVIHRNACHAGVTGIF